MAHVIVLRQCSLGVTSKLERQPGYTMIRAKQDLLCLLKLIQAICCGFKANIQPACVIIQAIKYAFLLLQDKESSNDKYKKKVLMHTFL